MVATSNIEVTNGTPLGQSTSAVQTLDNNRAIQRLFDDAVSRAEEVRRGPSGSPQEYTAAIEAACKLYNLLHPRALGGGFYTAG